MKMKLFAATLLALASTASFAVPVSFSIDPTHSYARYDIKHLSFSVQSGTFTQISGKVLLDLEQHQGSVDVSIDANSLQTFYAARDKHLKSEEFFNVAKFPTLTYKSNKLVFNQNQLTQIEGQLTLLGVTKPVTLTVNQFHGGLNPMTGKQEYGANATAHIKRSDFGMTAYLPAIADDVELDITIEALKDN